MANYRVNLTVWPAGYATRSAKNALPSIASDT
jgi:hypothetical protein